MEKEGKGKRNARAVKLFALFLVFMFVCTIVSRGIYASRMPRVALGSAEDKALWHKIEASGTVMTKEEVPVVTEAGLLMEKVCVVEGQKVKKGDVLFWLENEDLQENLETIESQIANAQSSLDAQRSGKNRQIDRAGQDLADVSERYAKEVGGAEAEHQAAAQALASFPGEEDYKHAAYARDEEYQKLNKAAEKKKATKEEKEAFLLYKNSLDARLSEEYAQQRQALESDVAEKQKAVDAANANRNDAVKQAQRSLEDAKKQSGAAEGADMDLEDQIAQLKKDHEKLAALREAEGRVLSELDGYVSRILVRAGERTGDTSVLVLSDAAGEKLFQAVLPQSEKAYVNPGDTISIFFQNGSRTLSAQIGAVGELEDGSCQITAKMPECEIEIGQTGELSLSSEMGRYACCVPLAALHTENDVDYVYLCEEQETILGTELIAKKMKVKVLEKDEAYAALEDGSLTNEEKFIAESDREIKDRARVRMAE